MKTRSLTTLAILTAAAIILGRLDSLLSQLILPIPGLKLGLSNLPVLYAVFFMSPLEGVILMFLKVGLPLSGTPVSALFSLAGGVMSFSGMLLMHRIPKVSPVPVSTVGGILHMVGQCLVGCALLSAEPVLLYAPWLLIGGTATGLLLGIAATGVFSALSRFERRRGA